MRVISFRLDDETYNLLQYLANAENLSVSQYARKIILQNLGKIKEEKNVIEALQSKLDECCTQVSVLNSRLNEIENVLRRRNIIR